jgi:hypothetical protein
MSNIKKENFKRISESRLTKIVALLKQIANLKNTSFYEYDEVEILEIFKVIEEEKEKALKTLLKAKSKSRTEL